MKFQKLSENKLKITLSNDELPNSSNFDDFLSDSQEAKNSFMKILDIAYDEVGFNTKDYKIKIDATSLLNGDFVFTVTKLLKVKIPRKIAKPKRIVKLDNINSNFAIYRFENFDDFCNFCISIKKLNLSNLNKLAKKIELYSYNNCYYLSVNNINENYIDIGKFYSSITEFCKYFSSKELFISVLKEKGNLIIKHNAINICQKHFI